MTLSEAVVLLRGHAPTLLEGLTPAELTLVFEAASIRRFQPGSQLTREEYPADSMYLLVQGRARFTYTTIEGRKLSLRWIIPGEVCGLAALLPRQCDYLLTAEAVKASVALVWGRSAIRSLALACPRLLDNALMVTFDYIHFYRTARVAATSRTARQRLALVLGDLAGGIGNKIDEGVEVNVRNEELASEAQVTIFTASRLLNEWQREGLLVKTRGKVVLRSPRALLR
jgi:CRP/FNR family transcriptional regulator, nitrogen oxide reductase regulator